MATEKDKRTSKVRPVRDPSLADAIIPLATLVALIAGSLYLFGLEALDGPVQAALIICALVAALIVLKNGHSWESIDKATRGALASVTTAMFILLSVGALIGVWNMSGTIPTLVYYGIKLLSPSWYYAASALICGAIALTIGSSWTTAGTIGVGLVGIATMLGVSPAITAGAVISGAYLGDKLSPLSETTVLTAQMVEVDLYTHIKRQAWTSIPAFIIAFVALFMLGFLKRNQLADVVPTNVELSKLSEIYRITPLNLLPLLLLIVLSVRKTPASLALMAATVFAGVTGALLQPNIVQTFADRTDLLAPLKATWMAMANGFSMSSGIDEIDRLLSRGGMASMLKTLWLIIGAVTFGMLLEEFGLIKRLIDPMIAAAKSTGRLFITVFACAFGLNIFAGDQYIALVLPSRIFRAEFARRGLAPTNLSRLAADSGTVTSALVPWNSCGAFMGAVLGVPTLAYAPFAIFNWVSPLLSVLYGITGFKVEKVTPETATGPSAREARDVEAA